MQILGFVLGVLGNVISIMVFASPMPTFLRILKKRTTESFSAVPYLTTILSNSLWLYYGLLKSNEILIVSISGLGCFFGVFYLSFYLSFASRVQRIFVARLLLLIGVFISTIALSTLKFAHGNVRITVVGVFCAANSACMYGSPLSVMKTVIKTKSVEYMPFSLSFFLSLSAAVWLAYALVIRDPFLMASNGIGSVFGILQLSLYAYYYNKGVPYGQSDGAEKMSCCNAPPYAGEGLKCDHREIQISASTA